MDAFLKNLAGAVLTQHFAKCEVPGCKKLSLGFICNECSRPVCQGHYFLRPAVPPSITCVACLQLELLENPVKQRRNKQEPEIIQATIMEDK